METQNTAKNFALQLGSLISLYVSISAILILLFGVITLSFPDSIIDYWRYDSSVESIRFSIAVLIVFFPTFIILTRIVNNIRRNEHGTYLTLTKWLIYLSLLIGGGILLGNLVAVINTFLNGDLTVRFLLKVLSMVVVVGAAFAYYLLDVRGYWQNNEKKSIWYGVVSSIFVIVIIILGYFNIETPSEVREMKMDDRQLTDLDEIQWKVAEYYSITSKFPITLEDAYGNKKIPEAPEGRGEYEYNIVDVSFELCAEFAHQSDDYSEKPYMPHFLPDNQSVIKNPNDWYHDAGPACFERFVN